MPYYIKKSECHTYKRSLLSSIVILNFFAILVVYALVHYINMIEGICEKAELLYQ